MLYTFSLGYFSTIVAGAFSYPLDTIRRRLMMTSGTNSKFKNNSDCIKKINSEGGWKAFFRGTVANILGGITGAVVFSVYDKMKVEYVKKYSSY
jgi:solute carrier family 25 (adenine nucleotide translocator) protein 4/5/6/31